MSAAQEYLLPDLAPLKASMSAGMRLASRDKMKLSSGVGRRDPAERCEVRAAAYRRDVVLKITGRRAGPGNGGAVRSEIRGFSHGSRRRLTHLVRNTNDLWNGFLTVTYPNEFPRDGREVKRHLNALCSWLRRRKVAYIWILEFQERGAPHFHFLVSGWLDKDQVAARWTAIVNPVFPSERAKMLAASTQIKAVKNPDEVGGYMGAYMSKLEQKIVPAGFKSVGRFWGASRTIFRLAVEVGTNRRGWVREPLNPKRLYRVKGLYADAARALRACRRWYARHCASGGRGIGFRWKWRGQGFILCDGVNLFDSILRQSLLIDSGQDVWKVWDGVKDRAAVFLTQADRLNLQGQMLIDGGFAPTYSAYNE